MVREERSLAETPTWAFATVICVIVSFSFLVQISMKHCGKWLDRTRRKSLFAALEKIKEELILFGVLSLLMGHWIVVVAKICIKSSAMSSRFFPCAEAELDSMSDSLNNTSRFAKRFKVHDYCSEGHESFASYESLEQLHRFLFVLAVTHISYSFVSIVLSMLKIYSWRGWENEAKAIGDEDTHDNPQALAGCPKLTKMSSFVDHQASHPWSQHHLLVWLLCFSRQFWSSINRSDYMALRLGFITTHQLPLSYDFHNYMLRSLEEEFRDIVGISIPLWIYTICCIFLDFHGSNIYFWLSFLPAILILGIGTKLHRVVVKLAVEIMGNYSANMERRQFKLRDELFWFGKPRLLLNLIQLISFQNAFEMANFLWSLWEIKGPSCFMDNRRFLVIRLSFGVVSQFWCSFITFPLYVIITQMGSRFKRTVVAENVRKSLSGWHRRVRAKHGSPTATTDSTATPTPTNTATTSSEGSSSRALPRGRASEGEGESEMETEEDDVSPFPFFGHALNDNEIRHRSGYGTDHATLD